MAIKHMTYKDLAPDRRAQAAAVHLNELRRAMSIPGVSDSQKQLIQARIDKMTAWVDGTLPEREPPNVPHAFAAPPPEPQHHEVVVTESVSIDESV